MSTAPYSAAVAELIGRSHAQIVAAVATHPDLEAPIALHVEGVEGAALTITATATSSPRWVARLTAAVDEDPAEVAELLDARLGVRVAITAGYVLDDGTQDARQILDLGLRRARVGHRRGLVDLTLTSDEALVVDASPAIAETVTASTTSAAIVAQLGKALSPAPAVSSSVTGPAVPSTVVEDRWDAILDLADQVAARVYDDGMRRWVIAPAPGLGSPALSLTLGVDAVLELDQDTDRDEWHNYVMIPYEWTDSTGAVKRLTATAYASSGPYAITGPAGRRIRRVPTRRLASTQAAANAAAAAILTRDLTRSRRVRVSTTAAYWVRPGHTVELATAEGADPTPYLVETVEFDALAGTMTVDAVAVDPLEATIATTTPPAAAPTPDPAPPAKQRFVSSWPITAYGTYRGSGVKRTDLGDEVAQGYYGTINGNQEAVMIFGGTSSGDETKTLAAALTGATVHGIRVLDVTATHSYSSAGGTARLGAYRGTALPASSPTTAPYVTSSKWTKGSTRDLTLTSSATLAGIADGTIRGITFGPGVGTDRSYYMKFRPSTVRVEIDYSR